MGRGSFYFPALPPVHHRNSSFSSVPPGSPSLSSVFSFVFYFFFFFLFNFTPCKFLVVGALPLFRAVSSGLNEASCRDAAVPRQEARRCDVPVPLSATTLVPRSFRAPFAREIVRQIGRNERPGSRRTRKNAAPSCNFY